MLKGLFGKKASTEERNDVRSAGIQAGLPLLRMGVFAKLSQSGDNLRLNPHDQSLWVGTPPRAIIKMVSIEPSQQGGKKAPLVFMDINARPFQDQPAKDIRSIVQDLGIPAAQMGQSPDDMFEKQGVGIASYIRNPQTGTYLVSVSLDDFLRALGQNSEDYKIRVAQAETEKAQELGLHFKSDPNGHDFDLI